MQTFERWQVDDGVYAAITAAADQYGVPRDLMLPVAGFESGFRPGARGDRCTAVGLDCINSDEDGYCSFGLFQFNRCGGAGSGHAIDDLLDATYNAQLAARTIRRRYDATGDWYAALGPWSTRPQAWAVYVGAGGDPGAAPGPGSDGSGPLAPLGSLNPWAIVGLTALGLALWASLRRS